MPRKATKPSFGRANSRLVAAREGLEFLAAVKFDSSAKRSSRPAPQPSPAQPLPLRPKKKAAPKKVARVPLVQQAVAVVKARKAQGKVQKKSRLQVAQAVAPLIPMQVAAPLPAPIAAPRPAAPVLPAVKALPVVWQFKSAVPSFALALAHKDNAVVFGNNNGEVLAFDLDGNILGQKIQLPSGVKTLVADNRWLYAGCDNGAIYDLTNRDEPRVIYSLPPLEDLLAEEGPQAEADDLPEAANTPVDPTAMEVETGPAQLEKPAVIASELRTKHVAFVLDTSASMAGAKINAALSNIQSIYANNLRATDRVSFVKFASDVRLQFLAQTRAQHDAAIQKALFDRYVNGWTALYDAMDYGYTMMTSRATEDEEQWVVVLTDGHDNQSKHNAGSVAVRAAALSERVNLIVISVGSATNHNDLQTICKQHKNGHYISVSNDANGIDEAFKLVAQLLSTKICYMAMADGLLSLGDRKGNVVALSIDGEKMWAAKSQGVGGWMILSDPRATYHGHSCGVTKYNLRNGNVEWQLPTAAAVNFGSQTWRGGEESVFVSSGTSVAQIDKNTGHASSVVYNVNSVSLSNAVSEDGKFIFVGTAQGTIVCFAKGSSQAVWTFATGCGAPLAMQCIGQRLFIATTHGALVCADLRDETIAAVLAGQAPAQQALVVAVDANGAVTLPTDQVQITNDAGTGVVLSCAKELSDNECLLIHNAIHTPTVDSVTIRDVSYPITRNANGCRCAKIVGLTWIEQNKTKKSTYAAMANAGSKITWTMNGQASHWGLVLDGVVKHNATKLVVLPVSAGFDATLAVQFPNQIKVAGAKFVVDGLELAEGKTHYRPLGTIKKLST